jgi:hypothetical protein
VRVVVAVSAPPSVSGEVKSSNRACVPAARVGTGAGSCSVCARWVGTVTMVRSARCASVVTSTEPARPASTA